MPAPTSLVLAWLDTPWYMMPSDGDVASTSTGLWVCCWSAGFGAVDGGSPTSHDMRLMSTLAEKSTTVIGAPDPCRLALPNMEG